MSSIALFHSNFTQEEELKKQLAAATGYRLRTDSDLLRAMAERFQLDCSKTERAVFGARSVFNQFTLEKERAMAQLRLIIAEELRGGKLLLCGFASLLIPAGITHVLRVGVFDDPVNRVQRAIQEGGSEKSAARLIKKDDRQAADWAAALHDTSIHDAALYDIRIPAGEMTATEMAQLVLEHYNRPAMLVTDASRQAEEDLYLRAQAEVLLVEKGYAPEVSCEGGTLTLRVNKASFNFSRLSDTLRGIVSKIHGVAGVEVLASGDSAVSIYRDQEFTPPPKILLVDDEQEFVQTLSERLITRQYGSYPVFDGEQALDCLETETPDVMVLDLKMPGMQGTEVLQKTREARPEIAVIVLTGHGSEDDRKTCMELGAFAYLQKPVDIRELTAVIDNAYTRVAVERLQKHQ